MINDLQLPARPSHFRLLSCSKDKTAERIKKIVQFGNMHCVLFIKILLIPRFPWKSLQLLRQIRFLVKAKFNIHLTRQDFRMIVSTLKINHTFYHELHFLTSWHISFLLTLSVLFIQIGRGVLSDFRNLAHPGDVL